MVEADDSYTGGHCKSVVRLALDVADELGLDADARRNVEFGALLHDVGKIAVPNEIINKPGELDEREWAIIKTHTIEGQRMLEKIGGFMCEIGLIVCCSHERRANAQPVLRAGRCSRGGSGAECRRGPRADWSCAAARAAARPAARAIAGPGRPLGRPPGPSGVPGLPGLELLGEVEQADLLELGR